MSGLQPVRGTRDLLPEDMRRHRQVVETARAIAERYGYLEIATPVFEFTEVFKRTLGETSDIVTKEMYTFMPGGPSGEGEQITLRPEATAGIARALISGGLSQHLPLKVFCSGPMFRHERPQKGRLRQFHQLDVELLGVSEPRGDVEIITVGAQILRSLGLLEKTTLELNTLGDPASRQSYRKVLVEYFSDHRESLSEDSLQRLERNPLRILDSKDEGDRRLVADAPLFTDYLNQQSVDFFEAVKADLTALGLSFNLNPRLVRGLDYYTHTAFEFVTRELGAQGAVMAGGRYDGLVETMGGPATPGVGWAAGIERLSMLLSAEPEVPRPIAVVPIGEAASRLALTLTESLRSAGIAADLGFSGNVGKRMKRANKIGARAAVIIGEDEMKQEAATVRDLDSGEQDLVPLTALAEHLARYR